MNFPAEMKWSQPQPYCSILHRSLPPRQLAEGRCHDGHCPGQGRGEQGCGPNPHLTGGEVLGEQERVGSAPSRMCLAHGRRSVNTFRTNAQTGWGSLGKSFCLSGSAAISREIKGFVRCTDLQMPGW